jgi:hypothetical protein
MATGGRTREESRAMLWILLASICFLSRPAVSSPQIGSGVHVDETGIGGVVLISNGVKPETGVWHSS